MFQDVVTDLECEGEPIPTDPLRDDWLGHRVRAVLPHQHHGPAGREPLCFANVTRMTPSAVDVVMSLNGATHTAGALSRDCNLPEVPSVLNIISSGV